MSDKTSHTGWATLGAGLAIAAPELVADYLHPGFTEAMTIVSVAIPVIMVAIVFAVIVRGTKQTCERVFRLLRLITNRSEPTGPQPTAMDSNVEHAIYVILTGSRIKPSGDAPGRRGSGEDAGNVGRLL